MTTSPDRPSPINAPKVLLVEGRDDLNFFVALLNHLGDLSEIEVRYYGGKDKLRPFLRTFVGISGFDQVTGLGIVRDADQDSSSAFASVSESLKRAGLCSPGAPFESFGTEPQVIVAIMPPQESQGELEDVLLAAVAGDPAIPCVDTYITCLEAQPGTLPKKSSKTRLHAFLASQENPGLKIGEAAQAGYFPWEAESFAPIINFLRRI